MENVDYIKSVGFKNDIVARMTVSVEQQGDIYEEVMHILVSVFVLIPSYHILSKLGSHMFIGNLTATGIHPTKIVLKNGVSGVMRTTILVSHVLLMSLNDSYEKIIPFSQ